TRAVAGAIDDLAPLVVGRRVDSAQAIESLHDEIVLRGYYPLDVVTASALSGIETSLFDLCGQAAGVPVHQLLGGVCRESVPAYSNLGNGETEVNGWTPNPDVAEAEAERAIAAGFRAVKVKPIPPGWSGDLRACLDLVKRLLERLGD